uniref:Uncharacterized protein n=1 Tax=Leersia perrieri TaxID=77586 RepID=A0A0D9V823_9ORYZ
MEARGGELTATRKVAAARARRSGVGAALGHPSTRLLPAWCFACTAASRRSPSPAWGEGEAATASSGGAGDLLLPPHRIHSPLRLLAPPNSVSPPRLLGLDSPSPFLVRSLHRASCSDFHPSSEGSIGGRRMPSSCCFRLW